MTTTSLATVAPELEQEGADMVIAARALVITDDRAYAEAGERRRTCKAFIAKADEKIGPVVAAAHTAHKAAVALLAEAKKPAMDADEIYKRGRLAYEEQQARIRREAEERQRIERERLEREENARRAAEQKRLQAEEEERRLAEATKAEQRGDAEAAERIIAEPVVIAMPPPRAVFTPPPMTAAPPPKVEGISARMEWDFEITNPEIVPREYHVIDEKKIRGVVRSLKESTRIPGVRVFPRRTESVRL